jgi:hypothetical protein
VKAPLRPDVGGVSAEIRASADRALNNAFAMHEAAIVLAATEAFDAWANEHPGMYSRIDVVTFLMGYGKELVSQLEANGHDRG